MLPTNKGKGVCTNLTICLKLKVQYHHKYKNRIRGGTTDKKQKKKKHHKINAFDDGKQHVPDMGQNSKTINGSILSYLCNTLVTETKPDHYSRFDG